MSARAIVSVLVCLGSATGCPAAESTAGGESDGDDTTAGTTTGTDVSSDEAGTGDETGDETGDPSVTCEAIEPGGLVPEDAVIPADCPPLTNCKMDQDLDGVPVACDNARGAHNPAQRDPDGDGFGEAEDLCPVVPGGLSGDIIDSDKDGYGNACDNCPRSPVLHNAVLEAAGVPFGMWVRNIPHQRDSDGDGVGDACDNCPTVANCGPFGADAPATVLDEPPIDDPAQCQTDTDLDGIGDACEGHHDPGAAGPLGFAADDDFDQDGLANADDACPRLWQASAVCAGDDDCAGSSTCIGGRCNHPDADGDGVGDACDTCPEAANPDQIESATAASLDDDDRDFIGAACELDAGCLTRAEPRPLGFFDVVAEGQCCVRTWPTATLYDTEGTPLATDCSDAPGPCRTVPADVAIARTALPDACEVALAEACREEASPVTLDDVGGDLVALWAHVCQLPPLDHDVDGIGDACDLCPFRHDPSNAVFVDLNGMTWPHDGAACNGDNDLGGFDPAAGCLPGT